MKRTVTLLIALIMLIGIFASCQKAEDDTANKNDKKYKSLDDLRGSSALENGEAYREEAAKNSGNKLNEKIKEQEDKKNGNSKTTPSPKETPTGGDNGSGDPKTGIADSMIDSLLSGKYAEALTKAELNSALKAAITYARKKIDKGLKSSDMKTADDDSKEYEKYPLYNTGNIIIFVCVHNDKEYNIAVGRTGKDAAWKVLNKK